MLQCLGHPCNSNGCTSGLTVQACLTLILHWPEYLNNVFLDDADLNLVGGCLLGGRITRLEAVMPRLAQDAVLQTILRH